MRYGIVNINVHLCTVDGQNHCYEPYLSVVMKPLRAMPGHKQVPT